MKKNGIMNTRLFLAIPCAIIVVALLLTVIGKGMNFGIDFTGGSLLNYSVGEAYDMKDVETILDNLGYTERQLQKSAPTTSGNASAEEAAEAAEDAAEAATDVAETATEAVEDAAETATEAVTDAAETATDAVEDAAEAATDAATDAAEAATDAVEDAAEAVEETAEEATEAVEEAAEAANDFVPMLNMDKSSVSDPNATDLQIRLNLKDATAGLENAVDAAVKAALPAAEKSGYRSINAKELNTRGYASTFSGGFVAEYEIGTEFDSAEVQAAVQAALEADYPIEAVTAIRYDAAAEKAAEEAAAAAEEAAETETTEETEEAADTEETEATEETEEAAEETEEVEETGTSLRLLVSIDDQTTQVRRVLEEQMSAKYEGFHFTSIDHVSAVAGRDLIANAVKALLIAFAGMLIYIAIRFDVFSGLAALFALAHDVLVMCAFMVFFRSAFQVNSPFIAAVLTIVGYSINNTIIIFDRIRETAKMPGYTQLPRAEIVEHAVKATLSRTINTALTTLITLVTLYIFGVDSIKEFAFPLIVGMLAGVYSSVLLSGQVWAMWVEKWNARKAAKKA